MPGLLSPSSPAYRAWSAAADLVLVNLLTLLGCLPVVTAGASLTACARVTMEMAREEETYVVRSWWRSARTNLIQSLGWWLPVLALIALGAWENGVLGAASDADRAAPGAQAGAPSATTLGALGGLLGAGLIALAAVLVWLVPLIAFFEAPLTRHLGNAVRLAVGHLGRTAVSLVVLGAPVVLVWAVPGARVAAAWFTVLIGPAFAGYLIALIQRPVLDALRQAARAAHAEPRADATPSAPAAS